MRHTGLALKGMTVLLLSVIGLLPFSVRLMYSSDALWVVYYVVYFVALASFVGIIRSQPKHRIPAIILIYVIILSIMPFHLSWYIFMLVLQGKGIDLSPIFGSIYYPIAVIAELFYHSVVYFIVLYLISRLLRKRGVFGEST